MMYYTGHLYLGSSPLKTLDMGVQRLEDNITSSHIVTPIVTYSAENSFVYDTSTQDRYSIRITRSNPQDAYDPLDDESLNITVPVGEDSEEVIDNYVLNGDWSSSGSWCNRLWKKAVTSLINRWQARTDGNKLTFIPVVTIDGTANTDGVFQRKIEDANVYIKSLTITYSIKSLEMLEVDIDLVRGSMCGQRIGGGD